MTANLSPTASPHDFVITRDFDAPRELVWKMWTDPKYLTQRVAPPGFTATVREIDVRTGGAFHIAMRSTEGAEFHVTGKYDEVIPLQRVVYWLVRSQTPNADPSAPKSVHSVSFDDLSGKTRVTISIPFDNAAARDAMRQAGGDKAMAASLDRVAELLSNLQS